MGVIRTFSFDEEPADVKNRVKEYWTKRSDSFSERKHEEVHSAKAEVWKRELLSVLPQGDGLRILDVGCGAGFFEMLLAPLGYVMTGIDLTPEMIRNGRDLLQRHNAGMADLLVMDAEHLEFPESAFDAVITRNLTWTLPHPADAYREWHRVLKPGGVLLNYDAEYAKGFHQYDQSENLAHQNLDQNLLEECHRIYHMLSISAFERPEWDEQILKEIGFREIIKDRTAGDRLYGEKDLFYIPDRMFCIRAVK